jgi:TonB family protein
MEASGPTPAADVWSLGATLVAVLTQSEPHETNGERGSIAVLGTIPEPLRGIARECLRNDAAQRITAEGILGRLRPAAVAKEVRATAAAQERPKRWVIAPIVAVALFVAALVGSRILSHRSATPVEETQPTAPQKPADVQEQKPAPVVEKPTSAQKGVTRGGVVHQVMPDVSRGAQNSITGHVKVSVQVTVDAAGNVSQAKLVSAGPSRYFAERALAAARQWKFTPAQVDGQASASEWLLRFQFGRGSMQVLPSEIRP